MGFAVRVSEGGEFLVNPLPSSQEVLFLWRVKELLSGERVARPCRKRPGSLEAAIAATYLYHGLVVINAASFTCGSFLDTGGRSDLWQRHQQAEIRRNL